MSESRRKPPSEGDKPQSRYNPRDLYMIHNISERRHPIPTAPQPSRIYVPTFPTAHRGGNQKSAKSAPTAQIIGPMERKFGLPEFISQQQPLRYEEISVNIGIDSARIYLYLNNAIARDNYYQQASPKVADVRIGETSTPVNLSGDPRPSG